LPSGRLLQRSSLRCRSCGRKRGLAESTGQASSTDALIVPCDDLAHEVGEIADSYRDQRLAQAVAAISCESARVSEPDTPMIEVKNLVKSFGAKHALRAVCASCPGIARDGPTAGVYARAHPFQQTAHRESYASAG
jgi:hypothetical protein